MIEKFVNIISDNLVDGSDGTKDVKGFTSNDVTIELYKLSEIKNHPQKKFNYIYYMNPMDENIGTKIEQNMEVLPPNVIENYKQYKNLNIIFINDNESESFKNIKLIDEWSKCENVSQKQLWIINNNKKLYEYKKRLETDINFYITDILTVLVDNDLKFDESDLILDKDDRFFFMCYNRQVRPHRFILLCYLKKNNILDNTVWTFINKASSQTPSCFIENKIPYNEIVNLSSEIKFFNDLGMKKSEYEKDSTYDEIMSDDHSLYKYGKDAYKNSYVNITTETYFFEEDFIHITEKSFKPFYSFQFPLIYATHQHLKYMRKYYDFDFFDDIINHDYDDEIDNTKRLYKFVEEVKRINENKPRFIEFYKNNQHRFINNHLKVKHHSIEENKSKMMNYFCDFKLL